MTSPRPEAGSGTGPISVRRARSEDATAIAALYRQLVDNPAVAVLPERIAQLEQDSRSALFVACAGNRPSGTVLVSLCLDVMFGRQPFAVVENLVVDASVRGRGVGSALLREAERFCLETSCSKMMLLSAAEREPAHRFFESNGFNGSRKKGFVKYRREFDARTDTALTPTLSRRERE